MRAPGMPLSVISAVTEKGIVRAICHTPDPKRMVDELVKCIGLFNMAEVTWTGYIYDGLPGYVSQWASSWDVPGGIYLFPWIEQTHYPDKNPTTYWRDPEKRRSEPEGQLLWRPSGWAGDKAERFHRVERTAEEGNNR